MKIKTINLNIKDYETIKQAAFDSRMSLDEYTMKAVWDKIVRDGLDLKIWRIKGEQ